MGELVNYVVISFVYVIEQTDVDDQCQNNVVRRFD